MIEDEDLEGLSDDPEVAFVQFERIARERFLSNDASGWSYERQYVNAIFSFVKVFDLDVLEWKAKAPVENKAFAEYFHEFIADIDEIVLGIRLRRARNLRFGKGPVLRLTSDARDVLHHHLAEMRKILQEADLPEPKREAILNKLNALAAEIDTNRTKWESWMALAIELTDTAEAIDKRLNVVRKLYDAVLKRLGQSVEEAKQLPPPPPRKQIEGPKGRSKEQNRSDEGEIPF